MFCVAKENKALCTGCSACVNICPKQCIVMSMDTMGFWYPVINETTCINCGLCYRVCPENNHDLLNKLSIPSFCYAAKHKNEDILMQSSSGGAFTAIVQSFSDDVFVFGASYDENMQVVHSGSSGSSSYKKFQKSKYVQSNLHNSFYEIKQLIKNQKNVIFTGTPCQIAGLKNYLEKPMEKLLCIELLCYGVSSPGVFSDYIHYLEEKYDDKVVSFGFRDKYARKGMWGDFLTSIKFKNGRIIYKSFDLFTQGFLSNIFTRDCCQTCRYATENRIGDIVIGDFWSIEKFENSFYSDKGVSLIIPVTNVGNKIVDNLSKYMELKKLDIQFALDGNRVLYEPTPINSHRKEFFELYRKMSINTAISACIQKPSIKRRIFSKLPHYLRNIVERIVPTKN